MLIVDDEQDILSALKAGLEAKGGFVVDAFTSGEDALAAIRSHPHDHYDIVLTDTIMPKMNGFELYRTIRQKNISVPVAFITAFEINEEEFSKVMPSIKVRDFIEKPIRIPQLIEKLNMILAIA